MRCTSCGLETVRGRPAAGPIDAGQELLELFAPGRCKACGAATVHAMPVGVVTRDLGAPFLLVSPDRSLEPPWDRSLTRLDLEQWDGHIPGSASVLAITRPALEYIAVDRGPLLHRLDAAAELLDHGNELRNEIHYHVVYRLREVLSYSTSHADLTSWLRLLASVPDRVIRCVIGGDLDDFAVRLFGDSWNTVRALISDNTGVQPSHPHWRALLDEAAGSPPLHLVALHLLLTREPSADLAVDLLRLYEVLSSLSDPMAPHVGLDYCEIVLAVAQEGWIEPDIIERRTEILCDQLRHTSDYARALFVRAAVLDEVDGWLGPVADEVRRCLHASIQANGDPESDLPDRCKGMLSRSYIITESSVDELRLAESLASEAVDAAKARGDDRTVAFSIVHRAFARRRLELLGELPQGGSAADLDAAELLARQLHLTGLADHALTFRAEHALDDWDAAASCDESEVAATCHRLAESVRSFGDDFARTVRKALRFAYLTDTPLDLDDLAMSYVSQLGSGRLSDSDVVRSLLQVCVNLYCRGKSWDQALDICKYGLKLSRASLRQARTAKDRADAINGSVRWARSASFIASVLERPSEAVELHERYNAQYLRTTRGLRADLERLRAEDSGEASRLEASFASCCALEVATTQERDLEFKIDRYEASLGYQDSGGGSDYRMDDDTPVVPYENIVESIRRRPGFEAFCRSLSFKEVAQLSSASHPIWYFFSSPWGSCSVLIGGFRVHTLRHAVSSESLVRAAAFGDEQGFGLSGRSFTMSLMRGAAADGGEDESALELLLGLLAQVVDDGVVSTLAAWGAKSVTLVTVGMPSVYPFGAASVRTSVGRQYLSDVVDLFVAPSVSAVMPLKGGASAEGGTYLAVTPVPEHALSLSFADAEVSSAARMVSAREPSMSFERVAGLPADVGNRCTRARWLHLASHSAYRNTGFASSLEFGDARLSVADVLSSWNVGAPFIICASCNSGATSTAFMGHEGLSIASALVSAGAGCVLGALWPIYDAMSAVLVVRTVWELTEEPTRNLAGALAAAGRWLRSNDGDTVQRWLEGVASPVADALRRLRSTEGDWLPWRSYECWLPFVVVGLGFTAPTLARK